MRVITLSRQFGSGGSEIAKHVSEKLGIRYVDKAILAEAASQSGIAKEHFENADEKRTNSFLFSLAAAHYGGSVAPVQLSDIITDDKLFIHTADAVKRLAGVLWWGVAPTIYCPIVPFCACTCTRAWKVASSVSPSFTI